MIAMLRTERSQGAADCFAETDLISRAIGSGRIEQLSRFLRVTSNGASPGLIACPPMPQMIGLFTSRARLMRAVSWRRDCTVSTTGKLERNVRSEASSLTGLPKSLSLALLVRDASG